jgi:cytochrome c2
LSSEAPNGALKKPAIPPPAKKDPALNIGLRGDRLYEINHLHKWFAIASLLMFVFTVWMIVDDYSREWRRYQRAFNRLSVEQTQLTMQAAAAAIDPATGDALLAGLQDANAQVEANAAALEAIQSRIDGLNDNHYAANQRYLFARARYDVERYDYEEGLANDPENAEPLRAQAEATLVEINEQERAVEEFTIAIEAAEAEMRTIVGERDRLREEFLALRAEYDRLQNVRNTLDPGLIVTSIRNAPVLDFMNPSEQVNQVILQNLYYDMPFLQVPRVDRCSTCHLGIDQASMADWPQPFTAHPRIDEFVGSDSPHPIDSFGCTTCHSGLDRAVEFSRAGHTPESPDQQAEWEARYQWHQDHFLETPMLPMGRIEASCLKCHRGAGDVPAAPDLNLGRDLIRTYGCFGCHNIPGYEGVRKVGPDLTTVSGKLDREWVKKWLRDPKAFKSDARMPKFWFNSNNSGPEEVARNNSEITAITEFLFSRSQEEPLPVAGPTNGDAGRGRALVESVGCFGCHAVGQITEDPDRTQHRRRFGYNLAGQGSKTSIDWLYNWVRDPEAVWHDTRMPSLRLTDEEAADVAAYLDSLTNPEWEAEVFPDLEEAALDQITLEFLRTGSTGIQARERLDQMTLEEKLMTSGEGLAARYGCFGCHIIEGYETAQPIGTELTTAGSKLLNQFDFGFLDIPHERTAWYEAKLTDPRVFDVDRVKRPDEKLRMPDFGFDEDQVDAIVMVLTGLVKDEVTPDMRNILTGDIEAGRALIARRNCRGCHVIEGAGADIRSTISDPGLWPPLLNTQGAKTQPLWLHSFIQEPGDQTLRPWLSVRMPTFHFDQEEATVIGKYFSAIDNVPFPFIDTSIETSDEELRIGRQLFEDIQCGLCHQVGNQIPARDAADLAPDLGLTYERLRPQWVLDWILDPNSIAPGTTMPAIFANGQTPFDVLEGNTEAQIEAIRNHLFLTVGNGERVADD